ncbi:MAG: leucyl aminopeptidase family protein [Bacillota bacterium]
MFRKQETIDLSQETKTLVCLYRKDNEIIKSLEKLLGVSFEEVTNEPFTNVFTLGKMNAKKVVVVREETLKDVKKSRSFYKELTTNKEDVLLLLDTFETVDMTEVFTELKRALYRFDTFKTKEAGESNTISYFSETNFDEAIHNGTVIGEAINHARELVNTPYNYLNASILADYAKALESIDGVTVKVLEKDVCEQMNMGLYLGVNKGSKDAPKLIHISYQGKPDGKDKYALVGKGVMYDTGGYSLKTPTSMPSMKMDMGGAATVLGIIEAVARLELRHNVDVIIAATDNRIGDDAIVPDDILTSAKGLTVEIISTDAEGRLTLADALWYAQQEGATHLIDIATLTGSIVGSLGKAYTGAFTNDKTFLDSLQNVTDKHSEPLWHMPISDEYRESLKSPSADLKNKDGRLAGASIAAAFLENFVEPENKWIHLDIAGTSYNQKDGATGILVKSITHYFMQ